MSTNIDLKDKNEVKSGNNFVIRPFIQTPNDEIPIIAKIAQWSERWGRTCGNPATSIIAKGKSNR